MPKVSGMWLVVGKGKKTSVNISSGWSSKRKSIPLVEKNLPKIKLGWIGKQKGILQVLWESGFIDKANINQYTMDGHKDSFGVHQPQTSLKHHLSSCMDFEEEESLLQLSG
jgi:hypothetical protein